MRTRFSFLILISAFLPRLFGQTTVAGGTISGVLSFTNSPFLITGNLNVPAGKSLTIEPGVEMRFMGSYELSVSGKIRARGNTTGRILFTSPDSLVGWRGLRVDPFVMEKDSCVFSFCDFKNGLISDLNDWSSFGVLTIKNTALVIVDNCSFNSNRSGSVFCKDAHFSVMASVFKYNLGGQILTVNCTANIGGNSLIGNSSLLNGGIITSTGIDSISISNNTISLNSCDLEPIIGCNDSRYVSIKYNVIADNNVTSGGTSGMHLFFVDQAVVENNQILRNKGDISGLRAEHSGSVMITGNRICNNSGVTATLYCRNSKIRLVNNILANNINVGEKAYYASCVNMDYCDFVIQNNTIVNNKCGGLEIHDGQVNKWIINNIVYGNSNFLVKQINLYDANAYLAHNDIQGGWTGIYAFPVFSGVYDVNLENDPSFISPTVSNGTLFPAYTADWRLKPESPCINAGDSVEPLPLKDIEGSPRVTGDAVDIGAHESPYIVGIPQIEKETKLQVFPNPAVNAISLRTNQNVANGTLTVYDVHGKIIKIMERLSGNTFSVDISGLEPGWYYFILCNSGNRQKGEFIVGR